MHAAKVVVSWSPEDSPRFFHFGFSAADGESASTL
jgi:hypothetical protein